MSSINDFDFSPEGMRKQTEESFKSSEKLKQQLAKANERLIQQAQEREAEIQRMIEERRQQEEEENRQQIELSRKKGEIMGYKCGIAYMQGFSEAFQSEVSTLLPEFFESFNEKLQEQMNLRDN